MASQPGLKRVLRFRDLTLFYIVSGLSVRWIASAAAAGPSTLVVWLLALFCFFIPLAACVLELSSRYPDEGGLYVWTREAFGGFAGFIAAWTYWMSNLPYFPAVLYFGAASVLFAFGVRGQSLSSNPAYYLTFAIVWLGIITILNIVGLDVGKWLNNVTSLGSIIPLSVLLVLAAYSASRFGSATQFTVAEPGSSLDAEQRHLLVNNFFRIWRMRSGFLHGRGNSEPETCYSASATRRWQCAGHRIHRGHRRFTGCHSQ